MKKEDKELYEKVKQKQKQHSKRGVKKVFSDAHRKLRNYTEKEQKLLGDWLTVLEMEIKKAI